MKILVIEDDHRVADLINRGLEDFGFTPTITFDGVTGQSFALKYQYDLIVTDIILPGIDGFTLCKYLKTIQPETPILMLTALGNTDNKVEGFDAGADDYLVKPFAIS